MSFRYVIADDAPFMREIIKDSLLDVGGVCVGEATNGQECIQQVGHLSPDFLFLDLVMPEMNGIECAQKISENFPHVQIILCSTLEKEVINSKLQNITYKTYITKPFSKSKLLASIN